MEKEEIEKKITLLELESFQLSQKANKCNQEKNFEEALLLEKEVLRLKQEHMNLCIKTGSKQLLPHHKNMLAVTEAMIESLNQKINPQVSNTSNQNGCYIATIAYGSYDHYQVIKLRKFRDTYLEKRIWKEVCYLLL
jgi:phosphotransacetylase